MSNAANGLTSRGEIICQKTIQMKSTFGNWRTVTVEEAQKHVLRLIDNGGNRRGIEQVCLKGISIKELLPDIDSGKIPEHLSCPKFNCAPKEEAESKPQ